MSGLSCPDCDYEGEAHYCPECGSRTESNHTPTNPENTKTDKI